ncbi:MAG: hypothetical protein ABFS43_07380 [Thermodesulfobacteriota bacterium]
MAIEFKIDRERNLAIYTLTGNVTVEEVKEVVRCFGESFELTKNLLWDTRPATFLKPLEREDVEQLVALMERYRESFIEGEEVKWAVIAETDLGFGIKRMFNSMLQLEGFPISLEPFRTIKDALEYIEE